jgi:DNA repair photolyase
MEPNSAPYLDRIQALRALHEQGCTTWVSLEPYPTPNLVEQDLDTILEAVGFVDKIIFGRMNYSKEVTSYKQNKTFYNEKAQHVIKWCEERHKSYHIKDGTITE